MGIGVVLAVIVLSSVLASIGGSDGKNEANSPPPPAAQEPAPPPPAVQEPPAAPPPPPPPAVEQAPKPIVLRGSGAKVETIRLTKDSPVVFAAVHNGSSNFIVHLVGPGTDESLINEIGSWSGEVLYAEAAAGRYRLPIQADGSWTFVITQPVPKPRDRRVPGMMSGQGSRVLKIRADDDLQPIVRARHRGQSNFIVHLNGYGDTTGEESLFKRDRQLHR
jgi:hypothetical protein